MICLLDLLLLLWFMLKILVNLLYDTYADACIFNLKLDSRSFKKSWVIKLLYFQNVIFRGGLGVHDDLKVVIIILW